MTQEHKVFGVIDTASLIFAHTQQCFIRNNKTPLVHSYAESEAFMDAGQGYRGPAGCAPSTGSRSSGRRDRQARLPQGRREGRDPRGQLRAACSVVDRHLVGGIEVARPPARSRPTESDCIAASAQARPARPPAADVHRRRDARAARDVVRGRADLPARSAEGGPCRLGAEEVQVHGGQRLLAPRQRPAHPQLLQVAVRRQPGHHQPVHGHRQAVRAERILSEKPQGCRPARHRQTPTRTPTPPRSATTSSSW